MPGTAVTLNRSWIDFVAPVPWWAWVVLAVGAAALIGGPAPRVVARAGGGALPGLIGVLLVELGVVVPTLLLVAGAASLWQGKRRAALRQVDVAAPDEAELTAAREAGRELAARGPLGLVLGGGGPKAAYQSDAGRRCALRCDAIRRHRRHLSRRAQRRAGGAGRSSRRGGSARIPTSTAAASTTYR